VVTCLASSAQAVSGSESSLGISLRLTRDRSGGKGVVGEKRARLVESGGDQRPAGDPISTGAPSVPRTMKVKFVL